MFEDEIKRLSHFDVYLISVEDLDRTYFFANREYQEGKFKIEFENTKHPDYYLNKISTYRDSLKNDYEIVKFFRSNIDEQMLNEYEKEQFNSINEFFEKVQQLLKNMNAFLSQHKIALSI